MKIPIIVLMLAILSSTFFNASARKIRLLSYNTWILPWISFASHRSRERAQEISSYLSHEPRADIIMLQEVFTSHGYKQLKQKIEKQGYQSTGKPVNRYHLLSSGLVTFSRFPIVAHKFEPFTDCKWLDCLAYKGMQASLVIIDKQKVYFVNTHLQSGGSDKREKVIKKQINQVKEFLSSPFFKPGIPIVLAGDFNTPSESSLYQNLLTTIGLKNEVLNGQALYSFDSQINNHLKLHPIDNKVKAERELLDYIFLYKGFESCFTKERIIMPKGRYYGLKDMDLSDHFAIESILELDCE